MGNLNRFLALSLIFLLLSSLIALTITPVTAQAGYKPTVPQFNVKLIDNSIDVPPYSTTTVDQYTGKETTTTYPGHRTKNWIVEITISNQLFTPYKKDGYEVNRYYNIQVKGHFGDEQAWRGIGGSSPFNSQYTVLLGNGLTGNLTGLYINHYDVGVQLDFRVKEIVAYDGPDIGGRGPFYPIYEFVVVSSSDWSHIQTITMTDGTVSSSNPSHTATLSPAISEGNGQPPSPNQTRPPNSVFSNPFFLLGAGVLFAGAVVAVVLVFLKRHLKTSNYIQFSTN
jgi:hypothetical protein